VDNAIRTTDFDYQYPPEAVAQHPLPDRSSSRLLVLDRGSETFDHRSFRDFPDLFSAGDVIVVNTSRVIPARLRGTRQSGSEAEVLLVHPEPDGCWLAMVHPGGKLRPGRTVHFGSDSWAEIVDIVDGGLRRIRLSGALSVAELMERHGTVPLPPYIVRPPEPDDRDRYQTVYAEVEGSVAAPTAGLHFTEAILRAITERLETAAMGSRIADGSGWSDLFIFPPYEFKIVDALLTNFHLPRSTLLMLVAAFAGRELTLAAYRNAVASGYRLFSYGDSMAVI
jgi:S-adenosylmethionine:tRNA ribosyltransferase-isomerase